ncbi:MAG: hypothetical protein OXG05_07590 [Gammaproteobacteria bacterium]|nr:hypothetical protein [Gammaproteobacteria bacterium]
METAYWVAWIVLYVFGIGLIALCVYPLRRRFYLTFFIGTMGVFWMLVPIPFNEVYLAPLFVTLIFQVFLDPDANYALSATAATVGSFTIIAATLVLYGFNFGYRHISEFVHRRLRTVRKYRTSDNSDADEHAIANVDGGTHKAPIRSDDANERHS